MPKARFAWSWYRDLALILATADHARGLPVEERKPPLFWNRVRDSLVVTFGFPAEIMPGVAKDRFHGLRRNGLRLPDDLRPGDATQLGHTPDLDSAAIRVLFDETGSLRTDARTLYSIVSHRPILFWTSAASNWNNTPEAALNGHSAAMDNDEFPAFVCGALLQRLSPRPAANGPAETKPVTPPIPPGLYELLTRIDRKLDQLLARIPDSSDPSEADHGA